MREDNDLDLPYALPLTYAALSELSLWSKMGLADRNVVDSAAKHVTFVKVGDPEKGLSPTIEYMDDFTEKIVQAGAGASKTYIVVPPFIDLVSDPGTLAAFLGKAKFEVVLESVYATYGVPAALTGAASGSAANNFMSVKALIKKLEYGRRILSKDLWDDEIKQVHAACNLKHPYYITFTHQELGDEAAIKKLFQDMHDREVISDETYRYMMGINHELEEHRIAQERAQRQVLGRPPKASPFHNANLDTDVKKIAVQTGTHAPEEVGTKLYDVRRI